MQITERRVAYFHYTLTDSKGEVLDSSLEREPLAYLHGAGNIVPGLEKALIGKEPGDKLQVEVEPEEGYGSRVDALVQQVPRSAFQGIEKIEPGMQFQAESNMGAVTVTVTRIDGDQITVDGNHPLAGETLHFDVEVTDVREASDDEAVHGHVHGLAGHAH